jgi:pyruvate, water dikinase
MYTKQFDELTKNDVLIAGGKGASLGEMIQAGIPVPSGFAVLASAFDKFIKDTDLNVEIDSILHGVKHDEMHTVERASEQIQALILKAEIPAEISQEVIKSFAQLGVKYVAVRSSATAEDSSTAAWAGQLDSFLNTTADNLLENVKKCWASLFTPRAIFYRFEKDLYKQNILVAVVVQKMIQSEVSGIAFSVHPVTEDKNQLIIEAALGLGEAIVSGRITPDSYVVEKLSPHLTKGRTKEGLRILDKNIVIQEKMQVRDEKGGSIWKNVNQPEGEQQVLSDREILELSELVIKIENHYGFPVDIEFAMEKGKLYIVQSRPITTLSVS